MIKYIFIFVLGMLSAVGLLMWRGTVTSDILAEEFYDIKSQVVSLAAGDLFSITLSPYRPSRFYLASGADETVTIETDSRIAFYAMAIDCLSQNKENSKEKNVFIEQYFGNKASQQRMPIGNSVYSFDPHEGEVKIRFLNLADSDQAVGLLYGTEAPQIAGKAKDLIYQLPKDKLKYARECK